ncbi:MAG TPA: PAS domain-containing protein [Pseudonocardiaceae bacterium]|nr:PAS domain-containing protein [Pseudonocardiaceae bacterium]
MPQFGPTEKSLVELYRLVDVMQEPAIVLKEGRCDDLDYRVEHLNEHAASALGLNCSSLVGLRLAKVVNPETAHALRDLCRAAGRSSTFAERYVTAPEALTDLSGTPSIAVRATRLDGVILCTWMSDPASRGTTQGRPALSTSLADRLELADTLQALTGARFGFFSFNLTTGRTLWSPGVYEIFGRTPTDGPLDSCEVCAYMRSPQQAKNAWDALVREGAPLNIRVRLTARLGSHNIRVSARAFRGADGQPVLVRGSCSIVAG